MRQMPSSYSRDDLIRSGHGELFGPEGPRLPLPDMLMFDRIPVINSDGGQFGKGHIVAELDISPSLWFFGCHFEGDPVMPGCLGLDALWQLVGFYLGWLGHKGAGRALAANEVKFKGQVRPTAALVTYELDIKRILALKLVMAVANGRVLVDGREIYTAKDLKVGLFTNTEGF